MKMLAVLAALFIAAAGGYYAGRKNVKPREYALRVDTLVRESVRLDTLWRNRKARYDSVIARYDTVRMHDTVVVDSIVYVPRDVADGIVFSCRSVLNTCEAQKANLTARLAVAESTIAAPRPAPPKLPWVAAGVLIGLIVK